MVYYCALVSYYVVNLRTGQLVDRTIRGAVNSRGAISLIRMSKIICEMVHNNDNNGIYGNSLV